jgi:recombination protein RecR
LVNSFPEPIERTLQELSKLPGVGKKSAMRILYHLLKGGSETIENLEKALSLLKENIERCGSCRGYKEKDIACPICTDPKRDGSMLCVVESTQDLHLIDSTSAYNGAYFVLHGLLSPFRGIGPEALGLDEFKARLNSEVIREVIIATPYTAEGEATSSYLLSIIEETGIKASRIGMGIPIGSDLSFVDSETLSRALSGRREVK